MKAHKWLIHWIFKSVFRITLSMNQLELSMFCAINKNRKMNTTDKKNEKQIYRHAMAPKIGLLRSKMITFWTIYLYKIERKMK